MCATTSQNYSKKISVATTVLSIPVLLSLSLILTGCQGVNSSASNAGTTNTAITLNQTSVNLAEGGTTQFSATVQNAASNSVNWSVDGVGGGNSTVGKITASGLYTAPMAAGAHTVTAAVASVSQRDRAGDCSGWIHDGDAVFCLGWTFGNRAVHCDGAGIFEYRGDLVGGRGSWRNSSAGMISSTGTYNAPASIGAHTVTAKAPRIRRSRPAPALRSLPFRLRRAP